MPRKRCPLQLASGVWIIADIPQVISDGIFWHDSKAICQRLKCSINKPRDLYVKRTVLLSSGECLIKSRWQSLIWLSNTEGYYRITFFFPSFSFFSSNINGWWKRYWLQKVSHVRLFRHFTIHNSEYKNLTGCLKITLQIYREKERKDEANDRYYDDV